MPRDKTEKLWIGGGAVCGILLAAGLWTFAISPKFDDVDSLKSQTADAQTQNVSLQAKVDKLRAGYAHMGEFKRALQAAQVALPSDSELSALTDQLNTQARNSGVRITQFTAAPPAMPGASNGAAAPVSSGTSAPTASTSAAAAPSSGLYAISTSLQVAGQPNNELAFLHAVQRNGPRVALVSSVQMGSGGDGGSTDGAAGSTMTIQLTVFVVPKPGAGAPSVAASAGVSPGATAPAPSASPAG